MKRLFSTAAAAVIALGMQGAVAFAQDAWPTKPITWIVPFAPGGNTDLLARSIAPKLSEKLGQTVIVENRPGAGGTLATTQLAAAPDGYTMQIGDISTHAISPYVYKNLTYDPIKDFKPVIQITSVSLLLVINPELKANSVADLIALVKEKPDDFSYASSGIGSPQHLAFEYFKTLAGIAPVHIPYNGSAPALTDVVAGHVQMMIDGTAIPQVKSGNLRALAVTGTEHSKALPDVPTMAEAGVKDYAFSSWHGVFFPAGVPDEIVGKVNTAIDEIIHQDDIKSKFAELNIGIAGGSPEKFATFIAAENEKMKALVASSGATQE